MNRKLLNYDKDGTAYIEFFREEVGGGLHFEVYQNFSLDIFFAENNCLYAIFIVNGKKFKREISARSSYEFERGEEESIIISRKPGYFFVIPTHGADFRIEGGEIRESPIACP